MRIERKEKTERKEQEREQGGVKRLPHIGSTLWSRSHREASSIQAGPGGQRGQVTALPLSLHPPRSITCLSTLPGPSGVGAPAWSLQR